jgi:hypothetical protein
MRLTGGFFAAMALALRGDRAEGGASSVADPGETLFLAFTTNMVI